MEIVAVTSHFFPEVSSVPMCCQAVVTPNVGSINLEALDHGASNICFMLLGYMGIGCDGKRFIAVYGG